MAGSLGLAKSCYSAQPRYRIFVKSYGFLPFVKNMGKNIG